MTSSRFAVWSRDGHPDATFAFPDAAPVMSALRAAGKAIAVVSDIHYDIRDHFVRHRLDPFVDTYVLSYEHGIQKPDAAMFTLALDELAIAPERALMVGDTPSRDGAAVQVGIPTYLLPATLRSWPCLPPRARRHLAIRQAIAAPRRRTSGQTRDCRARTCALTRSSEPVTAHVSGRGRSVVRHGNDRSLARIESAQQLPRRRRARTRVQGGMTTQLVCLGER